MKPGFNVTTYTGIFFVISAFIIVLLDMYLSTFETYTFDLTTDHILYGAGAGILLIVLPEDMIVDLIKKYFIKK